MLYLTRTKNESIIIGEEQIEIIVKSISLDPASVTFGIKSSKAISIHRKEIYDKIKNSNNGNHKHSIRGKL